MTSRADFEAFLEERRNCTEWQFQWEWYGHTVTEGFQFARPDGSPESLANIRQYFESRAHHIASQDETLPTEFSTGYCGFYCKFRHRKRKDKSANIRSTKTSLLTGVPVENFKNRKKSCDHKLRLVCKSLGGFWYASTVTNNHSNHLPSYRSYLNDESSALILSLADAGATIAGSTQCYRF